MEHRLKPSTVASKKWLIDLKVTPFFKKIPLNEIKPTHVRQWQNSLTSYRDENGKPYAQTYLKCINNQLTAIFNYAVKYYGLKENPCHKAGSMGKKHADEMLFWTKQEFQTFIEVMKDRPASYTVFMTMYYTGIREGELLALTPSDIDFEKKTLTVNKSYQRLGREDIITTPKTPKSIRTIPIPDGLCTCLQELSLIHIWGAGALPHHQLVHHGGGNAAQRHPRLFCQRTRSQAPAQLCLAGGAGAAEQSCRYEDR